MEPLEPVAPADGRRRRLAEGGPAVLRPRGRHPRGAGRCSGPGPPRARRCRGSILAGIPGEDQYDAPLPSLLAMVDILVGIQVAWLGRARGVAGDRAPRLARPALTAAIADLVERAGHGSRRRTGSRSQASSTGLPARFERIAACGLADGLVHGDCHPGNVRGEGSDLVLLDWGDCGVGHPLLDHAGVPRSDRPEQVAPVRDRWLARWRDLVPGSDPERAAALIAPVAAARQALIYQRFLDGIEASEHPYHQADVPDWLGRTAAIARAEAAQAPLAGGALREPSRPTWQTVRRTATRVARSMEVLVRERGVQSRRARAAEPGANSPGSSGGGPGFWPALAIIAVDHRDRGLDHGRRDGRQRQAGRRRIRADRDRRVDRRGVDAARRRDPAEPPVRRSRGAAADRARMHDARRPELHRDGVHLRRQLGHEHRVRS